MTKVGLCPWYERGFCPLGPDCSKRHVKGRRICQNYLTGLCPLGKECPDAQYVSPGILLTVVLIIRSPLKGQRERSKNSLCNRFGREWISWSLRILGMIIDRCMLFTASAWTLEEPEQRFADAKYGSNEWSIRMERSESPDR